MKNKVTFPLNCIALILASQLAGCGSDGDKDIVSIETDTTTSASTDFVFLRH